MTFWIAFGVVVGALLSRVAIRMRSREIRIPPSPRSTLRNEYIVKALRRKSAEIVKVQESLRVVK